MRQPREIAIAIFLATVGAVVPFVLTLYFSWVHIVNTEQQHLEQIGRHVMERARITADQAKDALFLLNKLKVKTPCSPEHINAMRKVNLDNRAVEEVGYFENGIVKCSMWGTVVDKLPSFPTDLITANGIKISFRMKSQVSDDGPWIAFQYQHYYVFVSPQRFSDVIAEPTLQIVLATATGELIGTLNNPKPELVQQALLNLHEDKVGLDEKHLAFTIRKPRFIAVVMEPREILYKKLIDQQLFLFPLGLVMATLMVSLVIYYSNRRLSIVNALASAIKGRELTIYYQPIIELETGLCMGAEALVRWHRFHDEFVSPDFFIPIAEKHGLITAITEQVVELVIRELGKLLAADRFLHISINLSARDIQREQTIELLETKLAKTSILRHQIWLETSERGFVEFTAARDTIERLRALGYVVAIDDFGTGYSNLASVQNVPLDILKIDKSFIETISSDYVTSRVTSHIINMAKTLNLKIVAEGIEKQEQLDYLIARRVQYGQGWFFAKALPAAEFIRFYKKKNAKLVSLLPKHRP